MISLIVAHDNNRCIGLNGDMPWGKSLKYDLAWFRRNTINKIVIMGSNTFHSIGKPLPDRHNIVLTHDYYKSLLYLSQGCEVSVTVEDLIERYENSEEEVFVIGGEDIYNQFLPHANKLYITHILHDFEGDTFFPYYNNNEYSKTYDSAIEDVYNIRFMIIEKNK